AGVDLFEVHGADQGEQDRRDERGQRNRDLVQDEGGQRQRNDGQSDVFDADGGEEFHESGSVSVQEASGDSVVRSAAEAASAERAVARERVAAKSCNCRSRQATRSSHWSRGTSARR